MIAIKAVGGLSIVQDPDEAEWPSMPNNALKRDHVDHVLPIRDMGELLTRLVRETAPPSAPLSEDYAVEDNMAAQEFAVADEEAVTPGSPSKISCPDCGGVLNEVHDGHILRFRCRVGHAYGLASLGAQQQDQLEAAWRKWVLTGK